MPEYVGGIVDFLNATANGPDAPSLATNDPAASIAAAQSLLDDAGITLLDPSAATDQNAFFVTQEYADDNGLTNLSDLEGKKVMLAAAADCKGRGDCEGGLTEVYGIDITKILPLGFASDADLQVGPRRRVAAGPDQHHRRHPGRPGPRAARPTTRASRRPRTSSRPSTRPGSPTTRTSRTRSTS